MTSTRLARSAGPAALTAALAMVASVPSAPLTAQEGRDIFAEKNGSANESFAKEAVRGVTDVTLHEAGDLSLFAAAAFDPLGPTGVATAATTEYKYDDGTPENFSHIENAHDQEYAQRFRLPRAGAVTSATACFGRPEEDDSGAVSFDLTFYRDSGGRPGTRLASYSAEASGLTRARWTCLAIRGEIVGQRLGSGDTWLGVRWSNSTGKVFVEDQNGPGGTRNYWRARSSAGSQWSSWRLDTAVTAYFIRLGVDHGGGTPDPDPDPPPPPTSGCTPTTTALQFDGGYKVSMCYRTPDGEVGQARSGIWASGQSGLLWFFDRGNAEVLVKVLDGCSHNGHRWAFVAPVTTLEFNLWITGPDGKRWTHGNRQGATASTRSDITAFRCSDEEDGDDGGGGDDGDDGNGGGGDDDGDDGNGGAAGTSYNVGDTITTLPRGSWFLNGDSRGCNLGLQGGQTTAECSRNGYFERLPYRYTCQASTCRIEGRTVTAGTWVETRR